MARLIAPHVEATPLDFSRPRLAARLAVAVAGIALLLAAPVGFFAAESPGPSSTEELLQLVPEFILESHFPRPSEEIRGFVTWTWTPQGEDIQTRSVQAETANRMPAYEVEITATSADSSSHQPWSVRVPFSASRMRSFSIPAATFPRGRYHLTARLVDPAGTAHSFPNSTPQGFSVADAREDVWPGSTVDAPTLLTHAIKQGTPSKEVYPANDARDTFSRTPWDMHRLGDTLYVGSGDWQRNTGPAPIWSIRLDAAHKTLLAAEYVICGESVQRFRTLDNKLYVPDIDPRDGWDFGNLYVAAQGHWTKSARSRMPSTVSTPPSGAVAFTLPPEPTPAPRSLSPRTTAIRGRNSPAMPRP